MIELHPAELQLRIPAPNSYEYLFVEGGNAAPAVAASADLELELHDYDGAIRAVIPPKAKVIAEKLLFLPPGEPGAAAQAPQLWIRAGDGLARFQAAPDDGSPARAWPSSALEKETRDVKISAWLDDEVHRNAAFIDLSVLLDNCERVELALTVDGNIKTARLRIWGPSLRLTLGRHATLGDGQLRPDRPPHENPSAPATLFHPLVLLSASVATRTAPALFTGALHARANGDLAILFGKEVKLTRWRHLPGHPSAGPIAWAVNDPIATGGLSALRGLVPFELPREAFALVPRSGGIEIESAPGVSPEEFFGETISLVSEGERNCEIALQREKIELRLRAALPALDFHWQRSVPAVPGAKGGSGGAPIGANRVHLGSWSRAQDGSARR